MFDLIDVNEDILASNPHIKINAKTGHARSIILGKDTKDKQRVKIDQEWHAIALIDKQSLKDLKSGMVCLVNRRRESDDGSITDEQEIKRLEAVLDHISGLYDTVSE